MADYNAILIWDPEDTSEEFMYVLPVSEIIIQTEDADQFSDSYEPTEGCTDP